jgi:hypothetical protein
VVRYVRAGRTYRAGARGATIRAHDDDVRVLPPFEIVTFSSDALVIAGTLKETALKRVHHYDDKQMHEYEDKLW